MGQYRNLFSGRSASDVLSHMLYDLGTFTETSETAEDMALKNYGIRLLRILGGGEVGETAIQAMVKQLMKQSLKNMKEE